MHTGRGRLITAGALFAVFVADILIAKVQVMAGTTIPVHLGDTLQFLVLLVAVAFFITGTMARERADHESGEPHET